MKRLSTSSVNFLKISKATGRAGTSMEIANLAQEFSKKAEMRGRELSEEPRFYCYALLDPRKPGTYTVTLLGGRCLSFTHEPFYIGKGTGRRIRDHLRIHPAKAHLPKYRKIQKLNRLGMVPILKKLSSSDTEAVALAKESLLIKALGRKATGGCLTNMSDGGEGVSNPSKKSRKALGERSRRLFTGVPKSLEHRRKIGQAQKGISKTQEHVAAIRQAALTRRPVSESTRRKLSENAIKANREGRFGTTPEGTAKQKATKAAWVVVKCPHCSVASRHKGNMTRYHFSNCPSA